MFYFLMIHYYTKNYFPLENSIFCMYNLCKYFGMYRFVGAIRKTYSISGLMDPHKMQHY